jgi:hypothetical protein
MVSTDPEVYQASQERLGIRELPEKGVKLENPAFLEGLDDKETQDGPEPKDREERKEKSETILVLEMMGMWEMWVLPEEQVLGASQVLRAALARKDFKVKRDFPVGPVSPDQPVLVERKERLEVEAKVARLVPSVKMVLVEFRDLVDQKDRAAFSEQLVPMVRKVPLAWVVPSALEALKVPKEIRVSQDYQVLWVCKV